MIKPIGFDGSVIEPRTVARLPLCAADDAELGGAAAGHVVAAFLEFDSCRAVVAAHPAIFFCEFGEASRGLVFGTFL